MTQQHAELDAALERVVDAARRHLAAVKAADGRVDDDDVWQAYVTLNNVSYAYDQALADTFGEVTPWEVESMDPEEAAGRLVAGADGADPHPRIVSVRQRRDYRVPSVAALLQTAQAARDDSVPADADAEPVTTVGEAVLELLQAGDGSLAALDVPQLEPLDGLLLVSEVDSALDLEAYADDDSAGPFTPAADDALVGRLDEHPFPLDDEEHTVER